MNPVDVEAELLRLVERLEDATLELGRLAEQAAHAEVAAKLGYARAYLAADGPVASREASATVASAEETLARRLAEGQQMAQRELLTTLRTQIDALRTIAANMRNLT